MKRMFFVLLIMCPLISLMAQISIDRSELPDSIGMTWFDESDSNVTVNVGTTGGPQTWNFTFSLSDPKTDVTTIIEPSTAPSYSLFPDANVVMFTHEYANPDDSMYIFHQLTTSIWRWLGTDIRVYGASFITTCDTGEISLPIDYLDTFRLVSFDTINMGANMYIAKKNIINGLVDAYGTLTIPEGSYPVLRIQAIDTCYFEIHTPDTTMYDTSYSLSYEWMTENYPFLASTCLDTIDFNFTTATTFSRFHGFTTVGVEEEPSFNTSSNSIILVKELGCYYVSFTDIQSTEVNIFDLAGRLNFTSEISGSGKLKLDLHNPGIYFITYDNSNTHQSDKLIIVK